MTSSSTTGNCGAGTDAADAAHLIHDAAPVRELGWAMAGIWELIFHLETQEELAQKCISQFPPWLEKFLGVGITYLFVETVPVCFKGLKI